MTRNPLAAGFHPDPSIVAVGDDYYLANSTFEYLPGIPVQHSTDLLTWTVIGHVVDRAGQLAPDVPTLGGAWAPTIRHHDGLFWIAVTDALGRGTLLFSAQHPAGPWSDGTVVEGMDGIDPDLAWDATGACFLTFSALRLNDGGRHDGILQVRIDEHTGATLEEPRPLWSGTGLMFPEGPHLYEIDGWWYLVLAEGGTERGHCVSVARSRRPDGPFEGHPNNPLLSARSTDRVVQNTGHGDLVRAPDGSWLLVLLGMRTRGATRGFSPMGRETFATPVTWSDGWPSFAPVELSEPDEPVRRDLTFSDALGPEWLGVRRFPTDLADLATTPGRLLLHGEGTGLDHPRPVFVGIRQAHVRTRFAAVVDASSGLGGLSLRYDEVHHYDIEVDASTVRARARLSGIDQEWTTSAPAGPVTLWIETSPVEGGGMFENMSSDTIRLGFDGPDGTTTLAVLDGRYLTAETTASFAGRVVGVYAVDGTIAVDSFSYTGTDA